jgi:hypothetical protein
MKINNYLLPARLRLPGIVLTLLGIVMLLAKYKFNYKPDFLNMKMFAIYSFYIETKTFSIVTNQMLEEFAGIILLCGLFFIAFSKEKVETEVTNSLRLKAFMLTAYFNLFFIIASALFFFGFGFVGALVVFAVAWLLFYLLTFRYLLYRSAKTKNLI